MSTRDGQLNPRDNSRADGRTERRMPLRPRDNVSTTSGPSEVGSSTSSSRMTASSWGGPPSTIINKKTNDPSAGPARRARSSPWPRISVEQALRSIAREVSLPHSKTIKADICNDLDYFLAADVKAELDSPAFRTSMVDGYAIRLDRPGYDPRGSTFSVVSIPYVPMRITLGRGQVARVSTGQSLSSDVDAVVMVEDTVIVESTIGGKEESRIKILSDTNDIYPGDNVREIGSDFHRGDTILRKGQFVSAAGGELSLFCAAGVNTLRVYPQPSMTVIDIIPNFATAVPEDRQPGNERLIQALLTESGVTGGRLDLTPLIAPRANAKFWAPRNNVTDIELAMESALASDIIITTGGVSMGEEDLIKPIIERTFRGKIHFGRVDMKPGMPTTFATIRGSRPGERDRLVFCLPEHPASIIVAFNVLVIPALHRIIGRPEAECGLPRIPVLLDEDLRADIRRTSFQRATVVAGADGRLHARSAGDQRQPIITPRNVGANALLCVPPGEDLRSGDEVLALITRTIKTDVELITRPRQSRPGAGRRY